MKRTSSLGSLFAALSITALAFSCSSSGPGSADDGEAQATAAEELQGSWQSNCRDADKFGLTESSRLDVKGTTATQVTSASSTGACGSTAVIVTQTARVSAGGEVGEGRAVDITVQNVKVKPVNETGVGILNLAAFCGITDWSAGEERDVSAMTGGSSCFPKLPKSYYDIFSIQEGKLVFGKGAGSTPQTRPQLIDAARSFTRR